MVSYSLEGKVALVTGAAYGIGFAMAEALAQAGAKIAFNCRSEEHLQKALEGYRAKGIEAKGYICDVRDEKAGHVLGKDVSRFEQLYQHIVATFRAAFPTYLTQTEHVLAVHFRLAEDLRSTADALADMVIRDGKQLRTGFVGTPYLLHVLSNYGHHELAYDLLLRKAYPGWLYSVGKGATTIWEHWDGIMEDGSFWSEGMNSFNHYAYGAVADWVYEKAAGIQLPEDAPGFTRVRIAPTPDKRIDWLEASIDTRHGTVASKWSWRGNRIRYDISTAVPAEIVIGGQHYNVAPGSYTFWEEK